ncbi:MAG: hypothetical protein D8H99_23315 [Streptococcus sp.]|nr:MAG: hypothetical protein D8H99_23315 [Streptococcus sp.]
MFITAFKKTISRMKSRLTSFSYRLLLLMTILAFVVPVNASGSTTQGAFRIIIAGILAISATIFLIEYLFNLEISMWDTKFRERSILNIFVKHADPKNHVYANLSTIVLVPLAIFVIIAILTNIVLPILFSLLFVAMCVVISIP